MFHLMDSGDGRLNFAEFLWLLVSIQKAVLVGKHPPLNRHEARGPIRLTEMLPPPSASKAEAWAEDGAAPNKAVAESKGGDVLPPTLVRVVSHPFLDAGGEAPTTTVTLEPGGTPVRCAVWRNSSVCGCKRSTGCTCCSVGAQQRVDKRLFSVTGSSQQR